MCTEVFPAYVLDEEVSDIVWIKCQEFTQIDFNKSWNPIVFGADEP